MYLIVSVEDISGNVDKECHICHTEITEELRYVLVSTTGVFALCNYCQQEQVVISELDEKAQDEGLRWVKTILDRL